MRPASSRNSLNIISSPNISGLRWCQPQHCYISTFGEVQYVVSLLWHCICMFQSTYIDSIGYTCKSMLHHKHPRTEICSRVARHDKVSQTSSVINRSANQLEHWLCNSVPSLEWAHQLQCQGPGCHQDGHGLTTAEAKLGGCCCCVLKRETDKWMPWWQLVIGLPVPRITAADWSASVTWPRIPVSDWAAGYHNWSLMMAGFKPRY